MVDLDGSPHSAMRFAAPTEWVFVQDVSIALYPSTTTKAAWLLRFTVGGGFRLALFAES